MGGYFCVLPWDWSFANNMRLKAGECWPVARMPQAASELTSLAERYPQVSVFALDVADFAQIERLAEQLLGYEH